VRETLPLPEGLGAKDPPLPPDQTTRTRVPLSLVPKLLETRTAPTLLILSSMISDGCGQRGKPYGLIPPLKQIVATFPSSFFHRPGRRKIISPSFLWVLGKKSAILFLSPPSHIFPYLLQPALDSVPLRMVPSSSQASGTRGRVNPPLRRHE